MTTKKGRQLFEGKSAPREKILATRMRKGPPPYVGIGPEWYSGPDCSVNYMSRGAGRMA